MANRVPPWIAFGLRQRNNVAHHELATGLMLFAHGTGCVPQHYVAPDRPAFTDWPHVTLS